MDYFFIIKLKQSIVKLRLIPIILFPVLSSCSLNETNVVEIIPPPILPKEFSSIPEQTEDPKLLTLISTDEIIKEIKVGRKDPFLPPRLKGDQLFVPSSFKYLGQISALNVLNAFVSYKDRSGFINKGDIGGETTDLLPAGWTLINLNTDTKVLTLGFEDRFVDVDLFPEK